MTVRVYFFWKKAPFIKLLLGLIAGIMLQWHCQLTVNFWWIVMITNLLVVGGFFFIPFFNRFKFFQVSGISATGLMISFGALLVWNNDIRNNPSWLGNSYTSTNAVLATLDEPLTEKTRSFKAVASVSHLFRGHQSITAKGKIIIYFAKEDLIEKPAYGSQILFKKPLQAIKNAGNPGGFDYKRYALFQGITHQVFLKPGEFIIVGKKKGNLLKKFIYSSRDMLLRIIRKNIPGEKERGLAEALLIGYKDDLDRQLVQSYSNTGVVHIIAISGLHLGLIYGLLVQFFNLIGKRKSLKWFRSLSIIAGLWLFSFLAGAQPSILRSALMFTCIVIAEGIGKRSYIFNTLALSAFVLLCINPYWLWDVGFQLSYAAVLSIIIFLRPIYNWFYIKNKILDFIWKLNAVTLAAQLLTVPISIFYFHQFPNYFLLTNILAVPLASGILLGEILLCVIAWIPAVALLAGNIVSKMIWLMNTWIERIESLPFSLWGNLQISCIQALLITVSIAFLSYWLMEKAGQALIPGLLVLVLFAALRTYSFVRADRQQCVIIYNVPQHRAIDFIVGRNSFFMGDSALTTDPVAMNFHLNPARNILRISSSNTLDEFRQNGRYIQFFDKRILLLDSSISFSTAIEKPLIDLLVISGKPSLYMSKLNSVFKIKQVVFDSSLPARKANYLKKDCDSLRIPWHDVTTDGAFVMNLN